MGAGDRHVYTAIFKMDNQQGPTVLHRELCLKFCKNINGKRICKEIDIRKCACVSSVASHVPYSL